MSREFKTSGQQEDSFAKVYLNSRNDFIFINEKDSTIFDLFADFLRWLEEKDQDIKRKEKEYAEKYGTEIIKRNEDGEVEEINTEAFLAYANLRTEIYREAAERIDSVFGSGTIRKYFYQSYEINPGFVPDDECIYDFLDEMTPILNELFSDRSKRLELKYNRNRKGGKRNKYRSKEQLIKDGMGR